MSYLPIFPFMKSSITSLFFVLCAIALQAQPTITKDVVFDLGATAPIQFVDNFFQPGASGENVSWDFGSVNATGNAWTWEAKDAATTQFADSFPSANLAFPFPQGDTAENLVYYRFSNDSLQLVGAASTNIGGTGETFYTILEEDPDLIATFPFTYQSSHTDTYRGVNWVTFGGMLLNQTRTATTERKVDGYGTLITPLGTFQNAVRVKTTEFIRDSAFFVIPIISTQEITRYTWYAEGEDYVLMHMDSIAQNNQGFTNLVYSSFYRSGQVTTSIDEQALADQWKLTVFPNPSSGNMTLSMESSHAGSTRITLHNMARQVLWEDQIQGFSGKHMLDFAQIPSGFYLLRVQTEAGIAARRILLTD